jgi:hypothetical protein
MPIFLVNEVLRFVNVYQAEDDVEEVDETWGL